MNPRQKFIAFQTIFNKEVKRSFRTWKQTFLPAVITTALYFLIFGTFIGSQIGTIQGVSYMVFIVPGLVLMAILSSSFQSMLTKFYFLKFQKTVQEILISPMPSWLVVAGYMGASVFNGFTIGSLVFICANFFERIPIAHPLLAVLVVCMTTTFFALLGLINAIYAKTFDDMSIVQTFFLTPLTYLGGIFYSVSVLPPLWQYLSHFNPVLYMINAFRYSVLGFADVSIWSSLVALSVCLVIAFVWVVYLFKIGKGLKA